MSKIEQMDRAEVAGIRRLLPDWPLVIWLIAATLVLALGSGQGAPQIIDTFNTGWGRALGEFALILLPSFTIAAAIARQAPRLSGRWATLAAPFAGAGMVCPDTAYAALAPAAGRSRLNVAFGAYAGFKLMFPAGPLIVAAGLGLPDAGVLIWAVLFLLPVWGAGLLWARRYPLASIEGAEIEGTGNGLVAVGLPFAVLGGMLAAGLAWDFGRWPIIDFFTLPKGALLLAAIVSLVTLPPALRRDCLDSALRRTGSLLLIIGAASAFGAVLTGVLPLGDWIAGGGAMTGLAALVGLFLLTALFKLVQGSSMATFATITPVAAPIVAAADLPPVAAVFAICFGSFIAILPNDSFYWLVREDALADQGHGSTVRVLSGGAVLQAGVGLGLVIVVWAAGLF